MPDQDFENVTRLQNELQEAQAELAHLRKQIPVDSRFPHHMGMVPIDPDERKPP